LARAKYFLLFCNIQLGAGSHPASCLMGTVVLSNRKIVWDVILSRHFSLQPRWTIYVLLTRINLVVVVAVMVVARVFIHVL